MFNALINESKVSFILSTDSALAIRSGDNSSLDPTLPNMQCIRTRYKGLDTVFIPGSSIKGVFRSSAEKIFALRGDEPCLITEKDGQCHQRRKNEYTSAVKIYETMCPACQMFGSSSIGSVVKFKDAYPMKDTVPVVGTRQGVGINRITGAAQPGALYDFEVIEDGKFNVEITLSNYDLIQLKVLLYVIREIDEGYIGFGSATSRGLGRMKVENFNIVFRDYRSGSEFLRGCRDMETVVKGDFDFKKKEFYNESRIISYEECYRLQEEIPFNTINK